MLSLQGHWQRLRAVLRWSVERYLQECQHITEERQRVS